MKDSTNDLRDQYVAAILRAGDGESVGPHAAADAVLVIRDEELERLRAELATALDDCEKLHESKKATFRALCRETERAEQAEAELAALKAAIETGEVARFAADVHRLVGDYSNEERGVIALTPFEATLDQLCLEKYGFDIDRAVAALDTPKD